MSVQLNEQEKRQLLRWQRRMVRTFVATWVYFLLVVGLHISIGPPSWIILLAFAPVLAFVVLGAVLQFSGRCPKCGYRLGRQSGLLIPERCRRCGVPLHNRKHAA